MDRPSGIRKDVSIIFFVKKITKKKRRETFVTKKKLIDPQSGRKTAKNRRK